MRTDDFAFGLAGGFTTVVAAPHRFGVLTGDPHAWLSTPVIVLAAALGRVVQVARVKTRQEGPGPCRGRINTGVNGRWTRCAR